MSVNLKNQWVDLQCRGYTANTIAERTNSDVQWVRTFLRRNNTRALERMAATRAAERAKQVLRLERMIEEAAISWEASVGVEETIEVVEEPTLAQVTVTQPTGPTRAGYTQVSSSPMSVTRTRKTSRRKNGDIAYLKAMQGFMADIRAILKIDDGTRRVDTSLGLPGDTAGIQATLTVQEIASQQLHEWNMQQKERLQLLLDMPPPDIDDTPDGDLDETAP